MSATNASKCRSCNSDLTVSLINLGDLPLATSRLLPVHAGQAEPRFPLKVAVCDCCWLCQNEGEPDLDGIGHYDDIEKSHERYEHYRSFARRMVAAQGLGKEDVVIVLAEPGASLPQFFEDADVRTICVRPDTFASGGKDATANVGGLLTQALESAGLQVHPELICVTHGLNKFADIKGFIQCLAELLKSDAIGVIEFPPLLGMLQNVQVNQIMHERRTYLSLVYLEPILAAAGLRIFEAEELCLEGGVLRLYLCCDGANHRTRPSVDHIRAKETAAGLRSMEGYGDFGANAKALCDGLNDFLTSAHYGRKTVAIFGASAESISVLNYCGVGSDMIAYCVDFDTLRHGTLLPGSQIPVFDMTELRRRRPDFMLVLPTRHLEEALNNAMEVRLAGTRFVTAIPQVSVLV